MNPMVMPCQSARHDTGSPASVRRRKRQRTTRRAKVLLATTTAHASGRGRPGARWARIAPSETPRIAQASRAMESTTPRTAPRIRRPRGAARGSAVVVKCQGNEVEELGEERLDAGESVAGAEGGVELVVQHVGPLQRAAAA